MIGAFGFLSEYNLLKSVFRLEDIIKYGKKEYPFIALNDSNNLYASYKLFKNANNYIIGMKLSLIDDEILIYALNEKGYENLNILSTMVMLNSEQKLTLEEIKPFIEGLYVLSSGFYSKINDDLKNGFINSAKERLILYKETFQFFSIGLTLQNMEEEIIVAPRLKSLSDELKIMLLPLNYMCYLKEDEEVFDVLTKVQDTFDRRDLDLSFLTKEELKIRYADYLFVFDNLEKVIPLFKFKYKKPKYSLPSFKDSNETLKALALKGLKEKNLNTIEYIKRMNKELSVLFKMGFSDYFLIVYDFVKYAKDNGILVGPGRGSAAGSLVSYLLNITLIDPLKYGLLFERFLNEERHSMPDIDLDFPDDKRDEVILYVKEKYGQNHVLSINTFSRFASRSAIRDVAKIKGFSPIETNQIIKKIEAGDKLPKNILEVLEIAKKFEGLPRQTGTHAAGIILAKEDLRYYLPMQNGPLMYQTQFEHEDLEDMGLLKIDFLGIRNLTIIDKVVKLIKKHKNIEIDLDNIPYNCKKTYKLLEEGDTIGIFQLKSAGMRAVLRKLKPNCFNDLVAVLALYRPGPMDNIDEYIERRNGKKFTYIDDSLKDILKETYGIIIYQEQIMQIAQKFAGYSLIEADLLRVGISKKDEKILSLEEKKFIEKSIKNGKEEKLAKRIYDYIYKFASYGFNKSHSVAYATISYEMAYLKANYYEIFMGVLLSYVQAADSQTSRLIKELRMKGFDCLPPDINKSTKEYEFSEKGLIYPLTGIKNIGTTLADKIILERENGPFISYDDFKNRLKDLNKRAIEGLIFSGALDSFGLNRKTLFKEMDAEVHLYQKIVKDLIPVSYKEYDVKTLILKEREVLGFNLAHSFKDEYEDLIKKHNLTNIKDLSFNKNLEQTIGAIKNVKVIKTKNDEKMAFLLLSDGHVDLDIVVFPAVFKKFESILERDKRCIVTIKNNYQKDRWILEKIKIID